MSKPYEKPHIISADEAIIAELQAENERLRSCLSDAAENRRLIMGEYRQLREENAKLRRYLEILRDYGIEIVDAVAGGFEIYSKDHALADRLKGLVGQYHSAMRCMLETGTWPTDPAWLEERMRELGIETERLGDFGEAGD